MSCQTSTWASVSGPAPIPMVGMGNCSVACFATSAGTISSTTISAPASVTAAMSSSSWAAESPRPWTLKPESWLTDCGVKPMCAQTGMPASVSALMRGAMRRPPSILIIAAPERRIISAALFTHCSSEAS